MLIVHLTYSAAHVHAMLSAFPVGLGSVIIYIVTVSETFPRYGVNWGSLSALAAAWTYLIVLPLGFRMVRRLKGLINCGRGPLSPKPPCYETKVT